MCIALGKMLFKEGRDNIKPDILVDYIQEWNFVKDF